MLESRNNRKEKLIEHYYGTKFAKKRGDKEHFDISKDAAANRIVVYDLSLLTGNEEQGEDYEKYRFCLIHKRS